MVLCIKLKDLLKIKFYFFFVEDVLEKIVVWLGDIVGILFGSVYIGIFLYCFSGYIIIYWFINVCFFMMEIVLIKGYI